MGPGQLSLDGGGPHTSGSKGVDVGDDDDGHCEDKQELTPGRLLERLELTPRSNLPGVVALPLEHGERLGDVFNDVVLLGDLPLYLLPLGLSARILQRGEEAVNLLDHALVVDGSRLVVPDQGHLTGELQVLGGERQGQGGVG